MDVIHLNTRVLINDMDLPSQEEIIRSSPEETGWGLLCGLD
ncbi:MAG: hypothetical protein V1862_11540 [Methanobacteriota archaeon]